MIVWHTRLLFWAHGFAPLPWLVVIHPSRRGDEALLAHEKIHCAQIKRHGVLRFWWFYLIDEHFRCRMEVEAYRVQLRLRPDRLQAFAESLASNYQLDLTPDEARELLLQPAT